MFNKAILVGRLTADPELRQTPNGIPVTTFSLAINRSFADRSTGERITDFINIVAWRQSAEFICRYFRKGSMIGVEGAIQQRNYNDKDGNKRTAFEVVVDRSFFVESKSSATQGSYDNSYAAPSRNTAPAHSLPEQSIPVPQFDDFQEIEVDDDLPF